MKSLFNYITEMIGINGSETPKIIVNPTSFKCPIDKIGNKASDIARQFIEGDVKDKCFDLFKQWYSEHSTRRNIQVRSVFGIFLCMGDKKDKLISDVLEEIDRIGVYSKNFGSFDSWDGPEKTNSSAMAPGSCHGLFEVVLKTATFKQLKDEKYIFKISPIGNYPSLAFVQSTEGNGYNKLPAETATIIRRKLYDCIIDSKYQIIEFESNEIKKDMKDNFNPTGLMPNYKMIITPVYDKSKLKKFLEELRTNKEWQEYAAEMDRVSKGIRSYYADKRSGDYVGD